MNRENAEILAIKALGWLAADEAYFTRFMAASGIDTRALRARAQEPEFLGFVLDFLLSEDALVLAFCESANLPPETPMQARACLPGGDLPNWT